MDQTKSGSFLGRLTRSLARFSLRVARRLHLLVPSFFEAKRMREKTSLLFCRKTNSFFFHVLSGAGMMLPKFVFCRLFLVKNHVFIQYGINLHLTLTSRLYFVNDKKIKRLICFHYFCIHGLFFLRLAYKNKNDLHFLIYFRIDP